LKAVDLAGKKGTPILFVGSAAEYGLVAAEDLPVREDRSPAPYNHHGISKLAQTLIGLAAVGAGHNVVIVRPGNILGARMPRHLLLGRVAEELHQIARGSQPPRIEVGNLDVARDFIDVESASRIYWTLLRNPGAYGEVVNVCSGKAISVRTLVERIIELSGISAELVCQPTLMRSHDPAVYVGSTSKLGQLIGQVPSFDMDKTLSSILSHMAREQ